MDELENLELTNVRQILDEYCTEFSLTYKLKLEADGKFASGNLIESVNTLLRFSGTTIEVILNVADYYQYVEEGRKPGKFPPLISIKNWILDKNILPRELNGKLPTEDLLAYLIGRKIANEGIEPGNLIKDTIEKMNLIYIEKLKLALEADFNVYQIKILENINKMIKI